MPTINVGPGSALELQDIADCLGKSRKVVVVTGAGISTNCGIPDFRSENGLYSLIQAQYDAALENPPWQDANLFDIDDAPKKKRRPWFYEVVDAEGNVVKTIDPEAPSPQPDTRSLRRTRRSGASQSMTSRQRTPGAERPGPSSISRRASLQPQLVEKINSSTDIAAPPTPEARTGFCGPQQESSLSECDLQETASAELISSIDGPLTEIPEVLAQTPAFNQIPLAELSSPLSAPPSEMSDIYLPAARCDDVASVQPSSPLSEPPSDIPDISGFATSTASPTVSSRPSSRRGSTRPQSNSSSTTPSSTPSPLSPEIGTFQPETRRHTLKREASSLIAATSDDELQTNPSSQTSGRASLPNLKGRDLFDSMVWSDAFTTSIFYMFISSLRRRIRNEVTSTTETHKFIRVLRDGGRLVRNYTQNIDSLEERVGLCTDLTRGPGSKARFHSKIQRELQPTDFDPLSAHNRGVEVVLLHGNLVALRCPICTKLSDWDEADRQSATLAGLAPDCPSCTAYNANRTRSGRRGLAVGRLRPDVVLYGEEHPNANLVGPLITHDLALGPDVLLILGTSLKVHGLKIMIREFSKTIHAKGGKVVLVNRTKPPESTWADFIDYWVEWDCDAWVMDLKQRRSDIWLPQGTQEEEKRRDSTSAPKAPSSRPQALRDDKMNGVYKTFKILDTLGKLRDEDGNMATRARYLDKPASKISIVTSTTNETSKISVKPTKGSASRKTKPKESSSRHIANTSKKRKSYPSAVRDDKHNGAYLTTNIWDNLRRLAPELPVEPPQNGRVALSQLAANAVGWFVSTPRPPMPETPYPLKGASNYLPNVGGSSSWPLTKVNLVSHPPSGETVFMSSNKRTEVTSSSTRRATISHPYGTRASRQWSSALPESTSVVDEIISSPAYDTIAARRHEDNDTSMVLPRDAPSTPSVNDGDKEPEERTSPTAPTNDTTMVLQDMPDQTSPSPSTSNTVLVVQNGTPGRVIGGAATPKSQRIKRMGSIGAILSSPSDGGDNSENSESTVYHDAQE